MGCKSENKFIMLYGKILVLACHEGFRPIKTNNYCPLTRTIYMSLILRLIIIYKSVIVTTMYLFNKNWCYCYVIEAYPYNNSPTGCYNDVDIGFIIDGSGSIRKANPPDQSYDNWKVMMEFIAELIDRLPRSGTRVGAVLFGNTILRSTEEAVRGCYYGPDL